MNSCKNLVPSFPSVISSTSISTFGKCGYFEFRPPVVSFIFFVCIGIFLYIDSKFFLELFFIDHQINIHHVALQAFQIKNENLNHVFLIKFILMVRKFLLTLNSSQISVSLSSFSPLISILIFIVGPCCISSVPIQKEHLNHVHP